jgi:hypothetical protein
MNNIVSARGSFSFRRGRNTRIFRITDEFRIKLTQIGAQIATLELVNPEHEVIQYPIGFRIHDDLYNEDVQIANGVYSITWSASYTVSINNIPRAKLFHQRQIAVFKAGEGADGADVVDEPAVEEPNIQAAANLPVSEDPVEEIANLKI